MDTEQVCIVCKKPFPATLEFFYAHPKTANGLLGVCKACQKIRARQSEQKNKDKPEVKARQAAKARRQHSKNRERKLAQLRQWRAKNPDASKKHHELRQERLKAGGSHSKAEFVSKVQEYKGCCHWCKKPIEGKVSVDHLIPISRGGDNSIQNVVPACRACNQSKHASLPHEFLARRPDLRP